MGARSVLVTTLLISASLWSENSKGISYKTLPNGFFSKIHVLEVDPLVYAIKPVLATSSTKRESVLAMTHRVGAIGGINGGFWKANGSPAGFLKVDNRWYGATRKARGAIGWSFGGIFAGIDRIIPQGSFREASLSAVPLMDHSEENSLRWKKFDSVVGGTPVLVKQGIPVTHFAAEAVLDSFLNRRNARTAVGLKENGDWVLVVVDSPLRLVGGVTIPELANIMWKLGCVEALNLDGGDSSTLVYDNVVKNRSNGAEREEGFRVQPVSDSILIFPRR